MKISNYYRPYIATSKIGSGLGYGAKSIKIMAEKTINPLQAGAGISVAWGAISALSNRRKYKQGMLTKRDAVLDTAGESVGMGLAAGLGLIASSAIRASVLVVSASSIIPFVLGVVVTSSAKAIWDSSIKRQFKYEEKIFHQQIKPAAPAPSNAEEIILDNAS